MKQQNVGTNIPYNALHPDTWWQPFLASKLHNVLGPVSPLQDLRTTFTKEE